MYVTVTKPLTFEEFLDWDDGSGRNFELVDGIPVPISEPNANHEVFRGQDPIESRLFPNLALTAERIFAMNR